MQPQDERSQAAAHLRQSQNLNALSALAGSLAHDFNNLLSILLVNLEIVQLDLSREFRAYDHLQAALEAGQRAKVLAQRLFTVDRQDEEVRQPVDLGALIEALRVLVQPTLPETIVFEQTIDPQAKWVLGHEAQLHQVLMNLCSNAMQAMEEREGVLEIRLDTIVYDGQARGDLAGLAAGAYARLRVRDQGPGLSSLVLDHLFDPFFTTRRGRERTGLGLAIVHSIIMAHQGLITAANHPDQGAIFTLYLPLARSASNG